MRSETESSKGTEADRLLNHSLVKEALKGIEDTIFYNFKTSNYKDVEEREELYRQLQSVKAFKSQFERWINDGKAARLDIDQKLQAIV